jgi:hypothetical protein
MRPSGEYEGKTLCRGNFVSFMSDYAFQTFPGTTCTLAMAFRVSTMASRPSAELMVVHRRMVGGDKNNIEVLYRGTIPLDGFPSGELRKLAG